MKQRVCLLLSVLILLNPARAREVSATVEGKQVVFKAEREICRYQGAAGELPQANILPEYSRGGYLHPIYSPGGVLVSDDYPSDHLHHHGIWTAWTKTSFEGRAVDFWNMGQKKGRVEFVSMDAPQVQEGVGILETRHQFTDLLASPPKSALQEHWRLEVRRVNGEAPVHLIDITSRQTCSGIEPLLLPQYHYGGIGFRGHGQWNGADKCQFLTSDGETDRVKGNTARGKWCWMGGLVDGKLAGVAILCHPDNFRSPQPMRLHPKEPFFCYAPQQLGGMEIKPGEPYVMRYRLVIADGKPTKEKVDRWWSDWTDKGATGAKP